MENSVSFGEWLHRRRKALDLTQDALAAQVGCSVGLIRKLESDERRPSRQMAELLAAVLQIPATERDRFIQVARAQLRTERLANIEPPQEIVTMPTIKSAGRPTPTPSPAPNLETTVPQKSFNLPIPPMPLIGRESELVTIVQLLTNPECRLLTIAGPGGMGKTRLALEVASRQQAAFASGVYFVAFAPLSAVEFMVPTIAHSLGIPLAATLDPQAQLLDYLHDKHLLLVLDNLEHLLEGVELLSELIRHAADVTVLATSRERLNLQGEWVFDLQGLPVPPPMLTPVSANVSRNKKIEEYSSVVLFLKSAQRIQSHFVLSATNERAIVRICQLVDGMPLGIELAAAWVYLLSCTEIAEEIERSIDFLEVNRRDVPQRHRSLRAVIDHSWKLISVEEQRVMCALSVFRGGFGREAAEQVAHASLAMLATLMARSLVLRSQPGRYDLHELVRQYAARKLLEEKQWHEESHPRMDAWDPLKAHARYFLQMATTAEQKLGGSEQVRWLDQLEVEHDNLRAVLEWARASGEDEIGLRLAAALMRFWSQRDYRREGRRQLMKQLEAVPVAKQPVLRMRALNAAAYLAYEENDYAIARTLYEEALALAQMSDDKLLISQIYLNLAATTLLLPDHDAARRYSERAIAMREVENPPFDASPSLIGLADLARHQGDYANAQALYEEGIALTRRLQSTNLLAYALRQASQAALHLGDTTKASVFCRESLALNQEARSRQGVIACLAVLAAMMRGRGQLMQAAQLLGAVDAQLAAIGEPLLPFDQVEYEQNLRYLQHELAESAYASAWQAGQAMTVEQAIDYALAH